MTFLIPIRTVSEANAHEHWRARQRRAKAQRLAVHAVVGDLFYCVKLPCTVTLTRIAPRALDGDNLQGALKAVRDEIAAAIGVDDGDPGYTWRYAQKRGKPREYAVRVEIS